MTPYYPSSPTRQLTNRSQIARLAEGARDIMAFIILNPCPLDRLHVHDAAGSRIYLFQSITSLFEQALHL